MSLLIKLTMAVYMVELLPEGILARPKVILVSMDGFRHDYISRVNTTNFDKMKASGVSMPYINNTFVTLTFPCHYTIVTGRYEESHGIIANHMYDSDFDSYFTFTTVESKWWADAEPIWISAKRSGLKTGIYFWPGSGAENQEMRPDEWLPYNGSVPYEKRVETVLQWMSDDDFDLGLLYFDEPDHSGHKYGPDANETLDMVEHMDSILGLLLDGIKEKGLQDKVNLIVTSDHGMANVDTLKRLIDVSEYANKSLLMEVVEQGTTAHIRPQPGKAKELVEVLSVVPHMTVMLKEDIPDHYHFKNHRRVLPVFAVAEKGWQITGNATRRRYYPFRGDHGYDNDFLSMKPIFVATGPAFKSNGTEVEPIASVDIYPLICHLLGIDPAPHNGSLARAGTLLRNAPATSNYSNTMPTQTETTTRGNNEPRATPLGCVLNLAVLMICLLVI